MSKQAANQVETRAQAKRAPKPAPRTAADQDAQTQKQAAAQIAFNKAKRETEEATAKASNARTLASNKAKVKPAPAKPLQVGSGAAVGVAKGAMDGQPHTQQAVREARAALTKAAQQAVVKGLAQTVDIAGNKLTKVNPALVVNGVQYPNAARAADARKAAEDVAAGKRQPAAPKAAKPKAEPRGPRSTASQTYKPGPKVDESRPGTFRRYMLSTILAHRDTDSAKAAHAQSGQHQKDKLNFKWAHDNGYIVLA